MERNEVDEDDGESSKDGHSDPKPASSMRRHRQSSFWGREMVMDGSVGSFESAHDQSEQRHADLSKKQG